MWSLYLSRPERGPPDPEYDTWGRTLVPRATYAYADSDTHDACGTLSGALNIPLTLEPPPQMARSQVEVKSKSSRSQVEVKSKSSQILDLAQPWEIGQRDARRRGPDVLAVELGASWWPIAQHPALGHHLRHTQEHGPHFSVWSMDGMQSERFVSLGASL